MSLYTSVETAGLFVPVGGILYRTTAPIAWEVGKVDSGWLFTVPANTTFDVSIPLALRWAFSPRDPRFLKAAAIHDLMLIGGIDRVTAAGAFNEALKADGVSAARRLAMTSAVAFYRWQ
ncbi:DUF1353 domain-containing protein [Antarcticirhabdus aurantiaca]|uniref:DUF1353 domain-containing protein n=1 Tax=Antarcticirhabdus aurantiaca TaxID=2606717 RepID=A0ACD4NKG3_9HYPH|nr:DUF1353 domain-containing protein [Antarcticirhabdus aurantiaca]WAJ27136.1 DUF1353 domain-containing protein [Jeongeuplla avenae]